MRYKCDLYKIYFKIDRFRYYLKIYFNCLEHSKKGVT